MRVRAAARRFGVLTGLSANLTSVYMTRVPNLPDASRLDGFDTFTGLPEAWSNGKGVRAAAHSTPPRPTALPPFSRL